MEDEWVHCTAARQASSVKYCHKHMVTSGRGCSTQLQRKISRRMEEAELMANPDLLKPLSRSKRQELATLTRCKTLESWILLHMMDRSRQSIDLTGVSGNLAVQRNLMPSQV